MEKNNKRKAELGEIVEGRVLLVAGAENPDGIHHDLIKVLEDHSYEVFKCNGVDGFLSQMKKNRFDIILTEGNLLDPMNVSQHLTQILRGMNLPVIMISSNENTINSHYHWLVGYIVRPILELVEKLFCDRINKSGEVKRLKEEIEQVELPDEEKRLKEEVENAELPDEEERLKEEVEHAELPDEEKRLKKEVEHAELTDEENKKKLEREKAGEHHQRMVWTGDREQMFVKIVTELDKNGKATGKKVWECMQTKGFKDISLKQVNSHLQKYRDKLKKAHLDSNSQMLGYKDQVDTSSEHDTSRHGMKEHSSNTDAPMNTINGNLNTTSQKHHLFTESLENNIPGNFGNPNILYDGEYYNSHLNGGCYIPSQVYMVDDTNFSMMDGARYMGLEEPRMGTQVPQSFQMPFEATPLTTESYTMGGWQNNLSMTQGGEPSNLLPGEPSNLFVCDIQGQTFDKDVPDDHPLEEYKRLDSPINFYFEEIGCSWNNHEWSL